MPGSASQPARWPLLLALGLTVFALLTLVWLRQRLVAEEQTQLENATRVFERTEALLWPENDAVSFSLVESNARSFEESDLVARLLVTKNTIRRGEVVLYPYYYDLVNTDWELEAADWVRLRVGDPQRPSGYLYVDLAPANRAAVDRAIWAFGLLLVICLGVLVSRTRGKEVELSRTVGELEQRKAEVIRLERLALAGQLSANIFHDIKKPVLNIKHEVADLLDSPEMAADARREALRAMREQTELFFGILRELGFEQFVRAEDRTGEYCDIGETIGRALALVKYEQRDVVLEVRIPRDGSLPLIFAPPHRLIQLFSNLALNAYQAMEGKGRLTVTADQGEASGVEIRFSDTGPGVPEELRGRLFEPFVTSKPESEGSGLGLFICAEIAKELGGRLELESTGEEGTRFLLLIRADASGPRECSEGSS